MTPLRPPLLWAIGGVKQDKVSQHPDNLINHFTVELIEPCLLSSSLTGAVDTQSQRKS